MPSFFGSYKNIKRDWEDLQGYVDDGWDNSGNYIEVYDEQGELMGAKILFTSDEEDWENWTWMDRPIQGDDFNSFAPPWSEQEAIQRGIKWQPTITL